MSSKNHHSKLPSHTKKRMSKVEYTSFSSRSPESSRSSPGSTSSSPTMESPRQTIHHNIDVIPPMTFISPNAKINNKSQSISKLSRLIENFENLSIDYQDESNGEMDEFLQHENLLKVVLGAQEEPHSKGEYRLDNTFSTDNYISNVKNTDGKLGSSKIGESLARKHASSEVEALKAIRQDISLNDEADLRPNSKKLKIYDQVIFENNNRYKEFKSNKYSDIAETEINPLTENISQSNNKQSNIEISKISTNVVVASRNSNISKDEKRKVISGNSNALYSNQYESDSNDEMDLKSRIEMWHSLSKAQHRPNTNSLSQPEVIDSISEQLTQMSYNSHVPSQHAVYNKYSSLENVNMEKSIENHVNNNNEDVVVLKNITPEVLIIDPEISDNIPEHMAINSFHVKDSSSKERVSKDPPENLNSLSEYDSSVELQRDEMMNLLQCMENFIVTISNENRQAILELEKMQIEKNFFYGKLRSIEEWNKNRDSTESNHIGEIIEDKSAFIT